MSIAKMKKLTLAAPVDSCESLIAEMMRLGCIEVEELSAQSPDCAKLLEEGAIRLQVGDVDQILGDREKIEEAIDLLNRYAPQKAGLFSAKPMVHERTLFNQHEAERAVHLAESIVADGEKIDALTESLRTCTANVELLAPWKNLKTPVEFQGGQSFVQRCGTLPAGTKLEKIREELAEKAPCTELWLISEDKTAFYLSILTAKSEDAEAMKVLHKAFFAEQTFKGMSGMVADELAHFIAEKTELEQQKQAAQDRITAARKEARFLRMTSDALANCAERERVKSNLIRTDTVFFLEGWFPENNEKEVVHLMERYDASYSIREPNDKDDVPVRLDENKVVEPFGEITQMYGMPTYGSFVDPNPTMAIFFFLAFGIMLSDAAYGILLSLGCLFMLKKTKPSGSMRNMLTLFFFGGISTIIWGSVFGSWFGNAIPVISAGVFGHEITPPALIDPINEPIKMMALSYAFGAVQVMTAMFLEAYRRFKRRDWQGALFGIFGWYVLFAGIGMMILLDSPVSKYVLIVGLLMVMYGGTLDKKGLAKIGGSFMALYNITGFFSDILSYSRLLALCLSTAVVANVVNTMGALKGFGVGGSILFTIVFIVGHIFNLALNLLGTYVHTSRLQYIEYFGRFYEGGGRTFRPLKLTTKYVDIVKED